MNDKSHHRGKMPAGGGSSQILCRPPDRADLSCFNRAVKDGSSSPDLLALRDAYLRTGKVPPGVRPVVVESWKRCRKYRLNPNLLPQQIADGRMLAGARQKNQSLLDGAEPLLELVHKKISPTPHVLALADREGRVLRLFSQHIPDEERAAANLFEGSPFPMIRSKQRHGAGSSPSQRKSRPV